MPSKYTPEQAINTFWSRVNKDGSIPEHMLHLGKCWEWTTGLVDGYGVTRWNGRSERSHRVSWMIANGNIPDGLLVLHKCDNRKCVNPDHLFLGTKKDNAQDRDNKSRGANHKGKNNGRCKLTAKQVQEIRQYYAIGGISYHKLADKYKLSISQIARIIRKLQWEHIS